MARYIKANRKVVTYLHLENDRNKLQDGNYILWLQDMMAFGPLPRLAETLERIGAISLLPHEAREEQYGITLRPLPTATDPEFVIETPTGDGEGTGEGEAQAEAAEGNGETEAPAEPETPTGEEAETETPANGETETPEEETPANGETTEETEESHEETQVAVVETGNDDNPNDTEE